MQEAGGAGSCALVGAIKSQAVCLLPPSLHLRKMGKKGDALQVSPYPRVAGKLGWAKALLAACSSHPPCSWH